MLKIKKLILFYILSIFLSSCVEDNNSLIKEINYGTSFGECVGYCKHDLTMTHKTSTYRCSGWTEDVTPVTKTEGTNSQTWDSINSGFNLDTFLRITSYNVCYTKLLRTKCFPV